MNHFESFAYTGCSFEERVGKPDKLHAALGQLVVNSSDFDHALLNVIRMLMDGGPSGSAAAAEEISISAKLDMLTTLVRNHLSRPRECPLSSDAADSVEQTIELCRTADDLRNAYLSATRAGKNLNVITSNGGDGFFVALADADPEMVLDVADYVSYAIDFVEMIPLDLGLANQISNEGGSVTYSMSGAIVAAY